VLQHQRELVSIYFKFVAHEIAIVYKFDKYKLAFSTAFIFVAHCVRDSIRTEFSIPTRRRVQSSLAAGDVAGSPWKRDCPCTCDPVSLFVSVCFKVVSAIALFSVVFRASRSSMWFIPRPSKPRCVSCTSLQPWSRTATTCYYSVILKYMYPYDNRKCKVRRPRRHEI